MLIYSEPHIRCHLFMSFHYLNPGSSDMKFHKIALTRCQERVGWLPDQKEIKLCCLNCGKNESLLPNFKTITPQKNLI